jgi:hypothetical protein
MNAHLVVVLVTDAGEYVAGRVGFSDPLKRSGARFVKHDELRAAVARAESELRRVRRNEEK